MIIVSSRQICAIFICNIIPQYLQLLRMMIQEQGIEEYRFIKGDYASIKIKMQPKSLVLDIPLDWQVNKIKCLLVRMIPKLQFDMFVFKHDNEEIDGNAVLRQLIEQDIDEQCINSDFYILTFKKLNSKKFEFQKYYAHKMKSLVASLENSPFEPILHPGYYSTKFISRLNQIPFEGGRDLFANFNQLQQLQNIVQEHRRQHQNEQGGIRIGLGLQGNNRGGGILQWIRFGFFRIIQVVSVCTLLNMVIKYLDIQSFIILAIVIIFYFTISYLKNKKKIQEKQTQKQQQTINAQQQKQNEKISAIGKIYFIIMIFIVSKFCLIVQSTIAFILSIFPNWDVEFHQLFFKNTYDNIQDKLTKWQNKVSPLLINPNQQSSKPQDPTIQTAQLKQQSQAPQKPKVQQVKEQIKADLRPQVEVENEKQHQQ